MKSSKIVVNANLVDFFRNLVQTAIRNQKVDDEEDVEFYLVHLLSAFHQNRPLTAKCPKTGDEEPFAITYLRAIHAEPSVQFNLMKDLGDRTLYLSGVFASFLEKSGMGLDYYMALGGNAYTHLAQHSAGANENLQELFQKLSAHFSRYTDVLSEVSESAGLRRDSDLLRLYERWMKTGSERDAKTLTRAGIPLKISTNDILQ